MQFLSARLYCIDCGSVKSVVLTEIVGERIGRWHNPAAENLNIEDGKRDELVSQHIYETPL